ncbi:hypothetical protein ACHAXA_001636 [Cyclostephanos tholiformis]|uniref:Uncharacterized protein n=1 Tax=Cyclostephanos tholiformis TaxID=382380 RepID=A0ABD3RVD0_9STRA
MLALGTNDAGLPVRRHFDWTIGSVATRSLESDDDDDGDSGGLPSSVVIMYGDVVNEAESSDRGPRCRANRLLPERTYRHALAQWRRHRPLGEPDRAQRPRIYRRGVYREANNDLLSRRTRPGPRDIQAAWIGKRDSRRTRSFQNEGWQDRAPSHRFERRLQQGRVGTRVASFGMTRHGRSATPGRSSCWKRRRGLRMLDGFLSRTLHHVMGPLHALRGTCEVVRDRIQMQQSPHDDDYYNCDLLERAAETVTTTTRMIADVSDLARFDEGASLRIKAGTFNALRLSGGDDGISVSLDLVGAGGPSTVRTDGAVLLRVLVHLLENAVREVGPGGSVRLRITSSGGPSGGTLFEVVDDGNGLPMGTCLDTETTSLAGKFAENAPIHRYVIGSHLPTSPTNDPDELLMARVRMEEKLRDLRQNGVGVGLPLSYHLVRSLGGDLRHDTHYAEKGRHGRRFRIGCALKTEIIPKRGIHPPASVIIDVGPREMSGKSNGMKRRRISEANFANFCSDSSSTSGDETLSSLAPTTGEPEPAAVAKCGVKASMPFSVLVVEDTDICARLLTMQLKKLNCSTQRAENGRVAIDILKNSLPGTFDMVLMDLRMPVMDGLEATKLIKGQLNMKYLPVVALTGEMSADICKECDEIGFEDFFQKPLKKDHLEALVSRYKSARN